MIIANRETLRGSLVSMVEWQVSLALRRRHEGIEHGAVPALSAPAEALRRHAFLRSEERDKDPEQRRSRRRDRRPRWYDDW